MDHGERIEQFKNMTEADPQNEMGHFSLGKAYYDAGDYANAIPALNRTLELNPTYSKAYHLLGDAQSRTGEREAAIDTLTRGFEVADERGDRMPRDAMGQLITMLGGVPPAPSAAAAAIETVVPEDADLVCSRCGRPSKRMPERPFKGSLGQVIWDKVCHNCWREWIPVGTKVINEMGLMLSDPRAQKMFDEHMLEFLQVEPPEAT